MEPRTRVLYLLVALLALLGAGLRVTPPWLRVPNAPPVMLAAAGPDQPAAGTAEVPTGAAKIVAANPFSADRAPPRVRYSPGGVVAPRPARKPAKSASPLRLVGTVQTPTGTAALIDADPAIPGAELYRPGDRVGDSRLVSVSDSAVVLDGPSGRLVLHLP